MREPESYASSDEPYPILEYHARYRADEMIKYMPYQPGLDVLVWRCGSGVLLDKLSGSVGTAWGIDRSLEMDEALAPRQVASGSLRELPFATASFDVVLAEHVLGGTDGVEKVLDECARILRAGGRLIAWEARRRLGGALSSLGRVLRASGLALHRAEAYDYLAYPVVVGANRVPGLRRSFAGMSLLKGALAVDNLLRRWPAVRGRSWHLILVARKGDAAHDWFASP